MSELTKEQIENRLEEARQLLKEAPQDEDYHNRTIALCNMALTWLEVQQKPTLYKYQPCGCVVCTCENEEQCQGCGAMHCGTHPIGKIPNPLYTTSLPEPKS